MYWALSGEISSGSNYSIFNMITMKNMYQYVDERSATCLTSYTYNSVLIVGGHTKYSMYYGSMLFSVAQQPSYLFFPQTQRLNPACITIDNQRVLLTGGFTEFWNRYTVFIFDIIFLALQVRPLGG